MLPVTPKYFYIIVRDAQRNESYSKYLIFEYKNDKNVKQSFNKCSEDRFRLIQIYELGTKNLAKSALRKTDVLMHGAVQ